MDLLPDEYRWEKYDSLLMDILRKNPHAKLLLDLMLYPSEKWANDHPDDIWETKSWQENGLSPMQLFFRELEKIRGQPDPAAYSGHEETRILENCT